MSPTRGTRRRRIAVITGTRAEYGLLRSTMQAIDRHTRLDLQIVVTGIHLLRKFGHTVDAIVLDGWQIDARVRMQTGSDQPRDQADGLSRGITGIARFLENAHTDVVLVLGDRIEALAGALAAVTTGRAVAHIHGGDVALGDFDDSLRHAITKLAHVHLAATRHAAQRIIRLGERPEHVHVVGAPGLDRLRELISQQPVRRTKSGLALVVQHASGRSAAVEQRVMTAVLNAVKSVGLRRLIIYPNSDRGHAGVLRAIEQHRRQYVRHPGSADTASAPLRARSASEGHCAASSSPPPVEIVRSLPRDDYLRTLMRADVLIGNSSSGIIEAPLAGTPSVSVGPRQAGRQPGGTSIIHAEESAGDLRQALRQALRKRPRRGGHSVYGDGRTGPRIAEILAELHLTQDLVKKRISY